MYLCAYVYIVYVWVYMWYMYVGMCVFLDICFCVWVYTVYMWIYIHIYIYNYVYVDKCVYVSGFVCLYYTCGYMYIGVSFCPCVCVCVCIREYIQGKARHLVFHFLASLGLKQKLLFKTVGTSTKIFLHFLYEI